MSRHTFAGHAGTTVAVGWDRPLATFFVQVSRPHPTLKGESQIVAWQGTDNGELPTAAAALEIAVDYAANRRRPMARHLCRRATQAAGRRVSAGSLRIQGNGALSS